MKHKTAELEGALLDAAVAKALGWVVTRDPEDWGGGLSALDAEHQQGHTLGDDADIVWSPSRRWEHGGPIIERERIDLSPIPGAWNAVVRPEYEFGDMVASDSPEFLASTPLIAAMRAFVSSKLGEEVELP